MCSILPVARLPDGQGRQVYNFSSLPFLKCCANEGRAKLAWAMPSAANIMQIIFNIVSLPGDRRDWTQLGIIYKY